jgi:SAM-dependent methyltransferase
MSFLHMLHRSKWFVYRNTASLRHRRLREKDSWFFDHFIMTAYEIGEHLSRFIPLNRSRVLDFGCGDGFTALGMSRFRLKEIIGVDINDSFHHLPQIACRYLGLDPLPRSLSFQKVGDGEPLPFETDTFDACIHGPFWSMSATLKLCYRSSIGFYFQGGSCSCRLNLFFILRSAHILSV